MTASTRLLVQVTDHRGEKCPAFVKMRRSRTDRWRQVPHDPERERHTLEIEAPAQIELRARGPAGWCTATRTLVVVPGDNHAQMVVGPVDALCTPPGERTQMYAQPWLDLVFQDPALRGQLESRLPPELRRRMRKPGPRARVDHVSLSLEPSGGAEQLAAIRDQVAQIVDDLIAEGHWLRLSMPVVHATGQVRRITSEMVIAFKSTIQDEPRAKLLRDHGLEPDARHVPYVHRHAYVAHLKGTPHQGILEAAARLAQHEQVAFAEPNYLYEIIRHEEDQHAAPGPRGQPHAFLAPEQPELAAIAAGDAWSLAPGRSDIVVAVVDPEGVDPGHPNLPVPIESWDFVYHERIQRAHLAGEHGTQCASSAVGTAQNGRGTAGVARGCSLIAAQIPRYSTALEIAEAWTWAAGLAAGPDAPAPPERAADVILNAWGPRFALPDTATIREAIQRITSEGRKGLGCVICFSAGNRGYIPAPESNPFAACSEKSIVVGACIKDHPTNPCCSAHPAPSDPERTCGLPAVKDARAYYSPYGREVTLVAPSSTAEWNQWPVDAIVSASLPGTGDLISHPESATSLAVYARASDTQIAVLSSAGFQQDGILMIGAPLDPDREYSRIVGIAGNILTIDPLHDDHHVGTIVATGPRDYSRAFGGTSYAASTVAGAAALVLSANPLLHWAEVREVLCATAARIEVAPSEPPWCGAGRLDAATAVQEALRRAGPGRTQ